jgi:predicted nuclease of predicted toxin-antitoxin system
MPKFIVDECTGMSVVYFLRKLGYDTMSVSESMPQAIDADILQRAIVEERIVVTNDKDFGDFEGRGKNFLSQSLQYNLQTLHNFVHQ